MDKSKTSHVTATHQDVVQIVNYAKIGCVRQEGKQSKMSFIHHNSVVIRYLHKTNNSKLLYYRNNNALGINHLTSANFAAPANKTKLNKI